MVESAVETPIHGVARGLSRSVLLIETCVEGSPAIERVETQYGQVL